MRPLFVNIGERTNVTGSARFKKLVVDGDYAAALAAVLSPEFAKVVDDKAGSSTAKKKAERVGVVLSGGNVDLEPLFAEMMRSSGCKVKK